MTGGTGLRSSVRAAVLAAAAGTAVACGGDAAPPDAAPSTTPPAVTSGSAADGQDRLSGELWVNPEGHGAVALAEARAAGDDAAAEELEPLAGQPAATWFANPGNPYPAVHEVSVAAAEAGEIPVLVAYYVPLRDCRSYSAGGAADTDEYLSWIGSFAAAIEDRPAIVVLEPDAIPQAIVGCEGLDPAERYQVLGQAVEILARQPGARIYLDAGNASWIEELPALADALRASNIDQADGFALNVSNFESTEASASYGLALSQQLAATAPPGTPPVHFVIDTSRNGAGPPPATAVGEDRWCNPEGRRLGAPPTTSPDLPRVDALLWIKQPGDSDGTCRGGPIAGQWWPEAAEELVGG
ncbi:glycoside hydrolase family 6 protein [Modestobacter lapidis]